MEIRQYLLLARKWAWLLILGGLLGGTVSYIFSKLQPDLYQTSTKIMVSAAQDQSNQYSYYSAYNDIQLAQSYAQIINTEAIMQLLSDKLGYPVGGVGVQSKPDSQVIVLTASDGDPKRAAEIANTVVDVFIEYIGTTQDKRYKETEDSLKAQIAQVEAQITTLQSQMSQVSESTLETQKQQMEEQSKRIEELLASTNNEAIQIETQLDTFIPTPAVTNTPAPSWIIPDCDACAGADTNAFSSGHGQVQRASDPARPIERDANPLSTSLREPISSYSNKPIQTPRCDRPNFKTHWLYTSKSTPAC